MLAQVVHATRLMIKITNIESGFIVEGEKRHGFNTCDDPKHDR